MGLPSMLASTYDRYKKDTDSVATWLASTAKSLGCPENLVSAISTPTTATARSGRLKGKARAAAKKKAASASSADQEPSPPGPKHVIRIRDFVPLADYIVEKAAPVPVSFMTTIDRVIATRSAFGDQLAENGRDVDETSDERHMFFVQGKASSGILHPRLVADLGSPPV
jgi:hypothetical protein